jgi:hypothetical protein
MALSPTHGARLIAFPVKSSEHTTQTDDETERDSSAEMPHDAERPYWRLFEALTGG